MPSKINCKVICLIRIKQKISYNSCDFYKSTENKREKYENSISLIKLTKIVKSFIRTL